MERAFGVKGGNHALDLSFRSSFQCCFPVKSHGQPSPCPEMSSSGLFKLLSALIGALCKCQQPVYDWLSSMGGHDVI